MDFPMTVNWYGTYESGRGRSRRRQSPTVVVKCEELEIWSQHWKFDRAVQIGVRLERVPAPPGWRRRRTSFRDSFTGRSDQGPWKRLFGIPGRDKVLSVLRDRKYVGVESRNKVRWLVPESHLNRFMWSRKRDKFQVVDLNRSPLIRGLVCGLETSCDDMALSFKWPETQKTPLAIFECQECGFTGPRVEFLTRMMAGLSSSVGIDCPRCEPKDIGAMGLAYGSPCGKVRMADDQPCLAPVIGSIGPERYL